MSRLLRRVRSWPPSTAEDLGEGAVVHPERLGDIGAAVCRGEAVVPVVHRAVAEEHLEAELPAGLARRDPAGGPVDRADLVAADVPAEPGAQSRAGGAVQPLGLDHLG